MCIVCISCCYVICKNRWNTGTESCIYRFCQLLTCSTRCLFVPLFHFLMPSVAALRLQFDILKDPYRVCSKVPVTQLGTFALRKRTLKLLVKPRSPHLRPAGLFGPFQSAPCPASFVAVSSPPFRTCGPKPHFLPTSMVCSAVPQTGVLFWNIFETHVERPLKKRLWKI